MNVTIEVLFKRETQERVSERDKKGKKTNIFCMLQKTIIVADNRTEELSRTTFAEVLPSMKKKKLEV